MVSAFTSGKVRLLAEQEDILDVSEASFPSLAPHMQAHRIVDSRLEQAPSASMLCGWKHSGNGDTRDTDCNRS